MFLTVEMSSFETLRTMLYRSCKDGLSSTRSFLPKMRLVPNMGMTSVLASPLRDLDRS